MKRITLCYWIIVGIIISSVFSLRSLASNNKEIFAKIDRIEELYEHPTTGTGHPEPLKGFPANRWSRRINEKHRLVYRILKEEVIVLVLSSYGHYDDK